VTVAAAKAGFTIEASDAHPALIAMWQALALGWEPPALDCTPEVYQAAKARDDSDPIKALIGFGASFGARYFEGFARGEGRDYFDNARRAVLRKIGDMGPRTSFECRSFEAASARSDAVIYCDPPYIGTTGYKTGGPKFDHEVFWAWVRAQSEISPVFVTEYVVPADARIVHTFARTQTVRSRQGACTVRQEHLVVFDRT